jgi:hypothetical protein
VSRKIVAVVSFSGMLLPQCFVYSLYTNSIWFHFSLSLVI